MSKNLLLVAGVTAGLGLAGIVNAQELTPRLTVLGGVSYLHEEGQNAPPPYQGRVDAPIFDNTNNLASYLGGPASGQLLWANDFSFAGTSWAGATNRHPTTFS